MQEKVFLLLQSLMNASYFEEAATAVLRAMLSAADAALLGSTYVATGNIVRGMVHLRPEEGYRRLVVLEEGQTEVTPLRDADQAHLPSTTAWRYVSEHACAVSIDVHLGQLQAAGAAAPFAPEGAFKDAATRARMLARETTHVHVVPLRQARSAIGGVISLEAGCRAATGQPFIWGACEKELQLLADIAAPYLWQLPPRPVPVVQTDAYMPVAGAWLANLIGPLRGFARQDETLLIHGPTGSGKTCLARWCHENSPRRSGPFESLDLNTVPEDLQLGHLFGWKRGAFSGATRDHLGYLPRAEGGTLFIDEIDKLSLGAQAGLLRLLDQRSYRVVGDSGGERAADVRFIVGTNANLQALVRARRFREDLFFRINVLPVCLPALRERRDEIAPWARYMATRRHQEGGAPGPARLTPDAERLLTEQSWPGNLRQLDNIIRRAYTLAAMEQGGEARPASPGEGGGAPAEPPLMMEGIVLREQHVRLALSYDESPDHSSLIELLQLFAAACVGEAERRAREGGPPLDWDLLEALRGVVLGVAVQRHGRDRAFPMLGREALTRNRNHYRALRRDLEKVDRLYRHLGATSPFSIFLTDDPRDDE